MKPITKMSIAMLAALIMPSAAYAQCAPSPTYDPVTGTLSLDAQDCHLVVDNPETIPTVPGTEVIVRNPTTGEVGSDGGVITSAITTNFIVNGIQSGQISNNAANISQNATDITGLQGQINSNDTDITNLQNADTALQGQITSNDGDITNLQSENAAQQAEIDANTAINTAQDATLADHEGRITTNEGDIADLQSENASQQTEIDNNTAGVAANAATNATQQTQLADHEGRIGNNESDIATNASGIAANKAKNVQQDNRLSGHDATLATHNNRIDTNAENIAINSGDIAANAEGIAHNSALIDELTGGLAAVAAMPDSYLNPDENFALAAGFGGYSDKTAFGVLGTARLTNNLSAYGGASIPLDDGDIAWKVGGRVGF